MVFKSQGIIWLAALGRELCGILGKFKAKRVVMMAQWVKAIVHCIWCARFTLCGEWYLHSLFWWVANIVIILLIVTCIKRVKMV